MSANDNDNSNNKNNKLFMNVFNRKSVNYKTNTKKQQNKNYIKTHKKDRR
jgi:hypothetical protein